MLIVCEFLRELDGGELRGVEDFVCGKIDALARELFEWSYERIAYFKVPAWFLFVDSLPTGTSQKVQKIHIFPSGTDPRKLPGAIDLRPLKKKRADS